MHTVSKISAAALLLVASVASQAADWSDTSLGYRFGNKYAEPFNPNDIKKNLNPWPRPLQVDTGCQRHDRGGRIEYQCA